MEKNALLAWYLFDLSGMGTVSELTPPEIEELLDAFDKSDHKKLIEHLQKKYKGFQQ